MFSGIDMAGLYVRIHAWSSACMSAWAAPLPGGLEEDAHAAIGERHDGIVREGRAEQIARGRGILARSWARGEARA